MSQTQDTISAFLATMDHVGVFNMGAIMKRIAPAALQMATRLQPMYPEDQARAEAAINAISDFLQNLLKEEGIRSRIQDLMTDLQPIREHLAHAYEIAEDPMALVDAYADYLAEYMDKSMAFYSILFIERRDDFLAFVQALDLDMTAA